MISEEKQIDTNKDRKSPIKSPIKTDNENRDEEKLCNTPIRDWLDENQITSTHNIVIPPTNSFKRIIGQEKAINRARALVHKGRNLFLIGDPGVGKSMIGKALADTMTNDSGKLRPSSESNKIHDVLTTANKDNPDNPKIMLLDPGKGKEYIKNWTAIRVKEIELARNPPESKHSHESNSNSESWLETILSVCKMALIVVVVGGIMVLVKDILSGSDFKTIVSDLTEIWQILFNVGSFYIILYLWMSIASGYSSQTGSKNNKGGFMEMIKNLMMGSSQEEAQREAPYLIISRKTVRYSDGSERAIVPFIDASGASGITLTGGITHDPYDTGRLSNPKHKRVTAGSVHQASGGILFIDEVATLPWESQLALLTCMQDKEGTIKAGLHTAGQTGRSIVTDPIPTDFIFMACGNFDSLHSKNLNSALRSRIIGNGYEVIMEGRMLDTDNNRRKFIQFITQEQRDDKCAPLDRNALAFLIEEAKSRSGNINYMTLKLRAFSGIIKAAGDIAHEQGVDMITEDIVKKAIITNMPAEGQYISNMIKQSSEVSYIDTQGEKIGVVNGLAVYSAPSGIDIGNQGGNVQAISVSSIKTSEKSSGKGKIIFSEQYGPIAKDSMKFISSFLKMSGCLDSDHDVTIQFLGSYGKMEGDSASIAISLAILSSAAKIPLRQDVAITGSLDVRGNSLPVGGVGSKLRGAYNRGIREVVIPEKNYIHNTLEKTIANKMKIHHVKTFDEACEIVMVDCKEKTKVLKKLRQNNDV